MITLLALCATSLCTNSEPLAAASATSAVLPPRGAKGLSDRVARALADDTLHIGATLSPVSTRERLLGRSDIARAIAAAKNGILRGEKAALHMKRREALAEAQRALRILKGFHVQHYEATLVARAHLLAGTARLLHPRQTDAAMHSFFRVFTIDREFRVDLESFPSSVARMLSEARVSAPMAPRPAINEMRSLAGWLGVRRLVWVRLRSKEKAIDMEAVVYDDRRDSITRSHADIPHADVSRSDFAATIGELVTGSQATHKRKAPAIGPTRTEPGEFVGSGSPPLFARATAPATSMKRSERRWYQRWWVWTLVGAVVAGSAVAIALAATAEDERRYSLRFVR